jgi:hypothetical protein
MTKSQMSPSEKVARRPAVSAQSSSSPFAQAPSNDDIQLAGGMRMAKWIKIIGISKATAWRWRKQGKLPVVWRYGLPWVTAETIRQIFSDDGTGPRRPLGRGTPLAMVLEKRRLGQALNAKEFAVCAGVSYSTARQWFRLPGFPAFRGYVFWQDFEKWRVREIPHQNEPPTPHKDLATDSYANWPPRALKILREASGH